MSELRSRIAYRMHDLSTLSRTGEGRRQLRRQYALEMMRQIIPVIGVPTDDGLILINTSDRVIGFDVYVRGQWDPHGLTDALDLAAQYGHPGLEGRTFVEVGGNIGTTTLQAAKRAARCVVVEPDPGNLQLLRANVAANDLADRVEVVAGAATAESGVVRLERSAKNHGDHRVSETGEVEVPAVRLDDVIADHEVTDIGLLWLDTQGHEAQVLAGAPASWSLPPSPSPSTGHRCCASAGTSSTSTSS